MPATPREPSVLKHIIGDYGKIAATGRGLRRGLVRVASIDEATVFARPHSARYALERLAARKQIDASEWSVAPAKGMRATRSSPRRSGATPAGHHTFLIEVKVRGSRAEALRAQADVFEAFEKLPHVKMTVVES